MPEVISPAAFNERFTLYLTPQANRCSASCAR
jgi:hypothetical protein